jgi:S-ribosylhomocysteine lyase LuxS involved in autoinducer biosynthesis
MSYDKVLPKFCSFCLAAIAGIHVLEHLYTEVIFNHDIFKQLLYCGEMGHSSLFS